jgi:hypothetical protein
VLDPLIGQVPFVGRAQHSNQIFEQILQREETPFPGHAVEVVRATICEAQA